MKFFVFCFHQVAAYSKCKAVAGGLFLCFAAAVGYGQTKMALSEQIDQAWFVRPPLQYGPFTRWWWPGNDVDTNELRREIRLFAKKGFAGVEIQPLVVGLNPESSRRHLVKSWDTPNFYRNIRAVMQTAKEEGMLVDMNAGSGWPMGGAFVKQGESLKTLDMSSIVVEGNHSGPLRVPPVVYDYSDRSRHGFPTYNKVDLANARLLTVTAARIKSETTQEVWVDTASVLVLDSHVENGVINWRIPQGGRWLITAFYIVPNGERPSHVASDDTTWVVDHFDNDALETTFERLFGPRTGLDTFYSTSFRGIFSDSKEFIADRHISVDFLEYFEKHRGYDIRPWLAANAMRGYNDVYDFGRDTVSRFRFSEADWRLRYDYDRTISDLYKERFSGKSREWAEQRGLLHRTQEYGIKVDVIGASGRASIPETEQLFARGSEAILKLVSSGADLYNRPLVSAEAFVFGQLAGSVTPQVMKAYANKAFAAGVNQLVYHGTPYRYQTGEFGDEGWTGFSTPFRPFTHSSNFSETYQYWKYIDEINLFIARNQYLLQAGKMETDVLVYFPFIDLVAGGIVPNPGESCISGHLRLAGKTGNTNTTVMRKWFNEVWPLINQLEEQGITWSFVNDESILNATVSDGKLEIRGNKYQALFIPRVPYVPVNSARRLVELGVSGGKLVVLGHLPRLQPSFFNYVHQDSLVRNLFAAAQKNAVITHLTANGEINGWLNRHIRQSVSFRGNMDFTRLVKRRMPDGSLLLFIWNNTDRSQEINLDADSSFSYFYWLNPENGSINAAGRHTLAHEIPPFSAIVLYASDTIAFQTPDRPHKSIAKRDSVKTIHKWEISIADEQIGRDTLFDWSREENFRFLSESGSYRALLDLSKTKRRKYEIDLGAVYHAADVYVNGKRAGTRFWEPYVLDITDYLRDGRNQLEIRVTPAARNGFIGKALAGNPLYRQYLGQEETILPAGLLGPVIMIETTFETH